MQYKTGGTNATDNVIRMSLQLVNTGAGAQSLSGVEVRYWFADSASSYATGATGRSWAVPPSSTRWSSTARRPAPITV
ncbi:cellulose binding domain-containing protein [Streptomyces sp. NPDC059909]|uniref:cellulose binding domain-containing protein n=1 Tax=Streptomyces sp. NPDC059909 TaxID=3346998 RepID=UPI003657AAD7